MSDNLSKRPAAELLNLQITGEESQNKEDFPSEQLVERWPIPRTPFHMIGVKDKEEWFIVMGRYKISEVYKTEQEALDSLEMDLYNTIINVVTLIVGLETGKIDPIKINVNKGE